MEGLAQTFGSLILVGELVSKSFGIKVSDTDLPYVIALVLVSAYLGLGLIYWNERAKRKNRRLFGEPHFTDNGVRIYESRYELPRLDYVFEHANKRIVILGRALTRVSIFDTQIVAEAVKSDKKKEVAFYFLNPNSIHAKSDTLNRATPNYKEMIERSIEYAKNARRAFDISYRDRFRIFTYDAQYEGTYILIDPDSTTTGASPYLKDGWNKAERLQVEVPKMIGDISHAGNQISTWKENKEFVGERLKAFNTCLKNVVEEKD